MTTLKTSFHTDVPDLMHFMENIPKIFPREGETIKNGRNEIKIIQYSGINLCVKAFKKVTVFNRLMYSWFRATKAERSYKTGKILLQKGIDTPLPLGYAEVRGKWGILKHSYYVSICQKNNWLLADVVKGDHPNEQAILTNFGHYMATKVHPAGIWHNDLSAGNILINKTSNGRYSFSLIDLNRIKIKKRIPPHKGIQNLQKLSSKPIILTQLAEYYAGAVQENANKFAFSLIGRQLAFAWFRKITKRFLYAFKPNVAA